jgi:protein TonB
VSEGPSLDPKNPGAASQDPVPGAAGTLQGEARTRYLGSHYAYIRKRIERALRYPRKAQRAGMAGRTLVRFMICDDGRVQQLEVVESSGYPLLDRNALKTVRRAAPFPAPVLPAEIVIPISYRRM